MEVIEEKLVESAGHSVSSDDEKSDKGCESPVKVRKSSIRISKSRPNFTEDVYQNQKKKIQDIMNLKKILQEKELLSSSSSAEVECLPNFSVLVFNDLNDNSKKIRWDFASFIVDFINCEEIPMLNSKWSPAILEVNLKGIELRNLVFRSKLLEGILSKGIEIQTNVTLKGEASFWLVLRSNDKFDTNSAIIRFSKDERSQRVFISMATFVIDSHKDLVYKVFLKQQLVNYSKIPDPSFKSNDSVNIKLVLFDSCEDKISLKIKINDSTQENIVIGDFFLPLSKEDKYRIYISAVGNSCMVKSLYCRPIGEYAEVKHDFEDLSNMNAAKSCDNCCQIY